MPFTIDQGHLENAEDDQDDYASGQPKRSARLRRFPACFHDDVPPPPTINLIATSINQELPRDNSDTINVDRPPHDNCTAPLIESLRFFQTEKNAFGIFHSFPRQLPSFVPAGTFDSICDSPSYNIERPHRNWWSGFNNMASLDDPNSSQPHIGPRSSNADTDNEETNSWWSRYLNMSGAANYFSPLPNASTYLLMNWLFTGSNAKTLSEADRLVSEVIMNPEFRQEELRGFNAAREAKRLDEIKDKALVQSLFNAADGWRQTSVKIHVPFERIKYRSEKDAPVFEVDTLFYRHPLEVVKAALSELDTEYFHFYPFRSYWQADSNSKPERIYSELYNSNAYLEEHERIQQAHATPDCDTVVAAIMLWSDSTQLANFGSASLWPIYLFLGNQSKYTRCKPAAFAAHHIAYIPKVRTSICFIDHAVMYYLQLGPKIQEFCRKKFGQAATRHVMAHLRRELMHAIWLILLDNEFIEAYIHGFLHKFIDGIVRRVFLRIFTYSADYPEKFAAWF